MADRLPVGAMPRQTKRTTVKSYDDDLELARALFDERTAFLFTPHSLTTPEDDEQTQKSINDVLNNEWQRDITIENWVARAKTAFGLKS